MSARRWTLHEGGRIGPFVYQGPDLMADEIVEVVEAAPVDAEIERLRGVVAHLEDWPEQDRLERIEGAARGYLEARKLSLTHDGGEPDLPLMALAKLGEALNE